MASNDPQSQTPVGLPPDVAAALAEYPEIVIPPPAFAPTMFANGDRSALREDVPSRRWDDPPFQPRHPFEVYIAGQASAGAWPTLKCARGTITKPHTSTAETIIAQYDSWTAAADQYIYIEVEFDADGLIVAAELKHGSTPPGHPEMFGSVSSSGNKWYHPIAQIKYHDGTILAGDRVIYPEYILLQLTNTHLRVTQECGSDAGMTPHYRLTPGPGAYL